MRFVGKNVVVYGAGVSGRAVYELVREKGAKAIVYDDDPNCERATHSVGIFDSADIIVLSPGVNSQKDFLLDAKLANKVVIGELELASRVCNAEQIAITGTNGKTTTTMLVDYILKRAGVHSHAVGNIGIPFSTIADKLDATEVAVIEASSFQLENTTSFSPDYAVLLNICPDHISRHKTMRNYINAKANICLHQSTQDYLIFNVDDENVKAIANDAISQKVPFSTSHPVADGAYISSGFVCFRGKPIVAVEDIDFAGRELENVLATVAVCSLHGVSAYCISSALMDFAKPKFRRQRVGILEDVNIYNDSKSTNTSACVCACESVDECVLIIGGQLGSEDFDSMFSNLPKSIKYICACGENKDVIIDSAKKVSFENICGYNDIKDALFSAFDIAKEQNISNIMFSPASKSFDSFKNFEERGKYFNTCVSALRLKR